jgi:hypothetical protein
MVAAIAIFSPLAGGIVTGTSCHVTERTWEIGIRLAITAPARESSWRSPGGCGAVAGRANRTALAFGLSYGLAAVIDVPFRPTW